MSSLINISSEELELIIQNIADKMNLSEVKYIF